MREKREGRGVRGGCTWKRYDRGKREERGSKGWRGKIEGIYERGGERREGICDRGVRGVM